MSALVSVTIRLECAEFVINPRAQTMRITELDGAGCPVGRVDEITLSNAIGLLRGLMLHLAPSPEEK